MCNSLKLAENTGFGGTLVSEMLCYAMLCEYDDEFGNCN